MITFVFVMLSVQRYQAVNDKYKDYRIVEHVIDFNEMVTIGQATYTFKEPKITEFDEYYEYEIPVEIKNNGENAFHVSIERFFIMNNFIYNQVEIDQFFQKNQWIKEGIAPGDEREVIFIFQFYKNWMTNGGATDLYYYEDIDGVINKYKLTLS